MSKLKVLHFTSNENDNCGIAKYQAQYIEAMPDVDSTVFSVSPYQTRLMGKAEFAAVLAQLSNELQSYDILHVQHEFGFFARDEFVQIAKVARQLGKKLVVTVHTSPSFVVPDVHLGGVGPRSILHYARQKRRRNMFVQNHILGLRLADMLLVHNQATKKSLILFGCAESVVTLLPHPVPVFSDPQPSTEVAENLYKQPGDVIYCTVGFIHRYKGTFQAIRALKYLPANYKLAILGGMHPTSDEVETYDKVATLIDELDLKDRVYISGFVREDERLNALIRECDVCVYPYDGTYYANVSSGSLNLAFANHRPVVAYPTQTFIEMNEEYGELMLCDTFSYYELARELKRLDAADQTQKVQQYSKAYAWNVMAGHLAKLYSQI